MANAEIVREYRGVIDEVISGQVRQAQKQRRSWPDYDKIARAAGLIFVSVDSGTMRPATIGLGPEHKWGVVTERRRLGNYVGWMAVVSSDLKADTLERRLTICSSMSDMTTDSSKEINDPELMAGALEWIRAPHFDHSDTIDSLISLTPEETERISHGLGRLEEINGRLRADLERIRQMHSRSAIDCDDIILG